MLLNNNNNNNNNNNSNRYNTTWTNEYSTPPIRGNGRSSAVAEKLCDISIT